MAFDQLFHSRSVAESIALLKTSSHWLDDDQVDERIIEYGLNTLPKAKEPSWFMIILSQFHNVLVYILLWVVVLSLFFAKYVDAGVILSVLCINALIGAVQEIRAKKAMKALSGMVVQTAKVRRNNEIITVAAQYVVPGDILIIEEGDNIVADARIISLSNFRAVESSLTGEAYPLSKTLEALSENLAVADRTNMVWMGTHASSGRAEAVVVATWFSTQLWQIASSLSSIGVRTSQFQKNIASLSKVIAVIALAAALINAWLSYLNNHSWIDTITFSIASLVSGIPEWLPAILSLVLAIWARTMSYKHAIVRSLTATETLWAVSIICTDKTGTLTQNAMTVKNIVSSPDRIYAVTGNGRAETGEFTYDHATISPDDHQDLLRMLLMANLSNQWSLHYDAKWKRKLIGDPTEIALAVVAKKHWLTKESVAEEYTIIADLPFNAEKKMRATLIEHDHKREIIVIGATDNVIADSSLSAEDRTSRWTIIEGYSSHGNRLLAFASKEVADDKETLEIKDLTDLVFVGCMTIHDPLRVEVPDAIQQCHKAGIRVIMMTGDHKSTAKSIGTALGIVNEDYPDAVTESELYNVSDKELLQITKTCNIFARCTPQRKLQILSLLQSEWEIVAMTGDGVNDAPAIKKADVGIAMGIMGTDVAREASQIVLADDNFATIVAAIQQWRIIYNNVKKSSLLAINRVIAGMGSLIALLLWSNTIPFIAIQLLRLNLVTETITGIGIAFEWAEWDEMLDKPRRPWQSLVQLNDMIALFINAATMIVLVVWTYIAVYMTTQDRLLTTTVSFLVLYFCQFANLYNLRSLHRSVFSLGLFSNKAILIGTGVSVLLQLLAMHRIFLSDVLWFTWIWWQLFLYALWASCLVFWIGELYKYIRRNNSILT